MGNLYKKAAIVGLVALCLASLSHAEERMRIVQHKASPLRLAAQVERPDISSTFDGQIWVSGTLIGDWVGGIDNIKYKLPDFLFVPDAPTIAKLPYYALNEPPYFRRYKVKVIEVLNGADALSAALGDKTVQELLNRKLPRLKATGAFLLTAYQVGVECDAPWAKAKLVKAKLPQQLASMHLEAPETC